ncbi:RDD family protein [Serinibacter arcticus]|nr:RDD family protein [Serinibacter arcticus]
MVALQPDVSTTTRETRSSDDWFRRVAAVLLDGSLLGGVTWLAVGAGSVVPSLQPPFSGGLVNPGAGETMEWTRSGWVLATIAALVLLQAVTGATPGKRLVGVMVVREGTLRPAGLGRTLARPFLHVLDSLLLIGYLRPLWNPRRQTFADSILRTNVVSRTPELPAWLANRVGPGSRRRSRLVTAAAGLVCALGVGLSFPIGRVAPVPAVPPTACGDLTVLDAGDAAQAQATVRQEGSRQYERRLWIERPVVTVAPAAIITWAWDADAVSGMRSEQEAWLRTSIDPAAPDGSLTWGLAPGAPNQGRLAADQQLGSDEVGRVGEDGWIESTLVLDGVPVATCTVTGEELGLG